MKVFVIIALSINILVYLIGIISTIENEDAKGLLTASILFILAVIALVFTCVSKFC
jgi:hypothetical protein